jgi:hypothetical protein
MDDTFQIIPHPRAMLEQNLSAERADEETTDEDGFAIFSPSGFAIFSPSGFAIFSPSGFAIF